MATFGTPTWKLKSDKTDRAGLRTIVLGLKWQPPKNASPDDIRKLQPAGPTIPNFTAFLPETRAYGGFLETEWTYIGASVEGLPAKAIPEFSFDAGYSVKDIHQFWDIKNLMDEYQGTKDASGKIIFPGPQYLDEITGQMERNPMWGVESFYDFGELSIYTYSYVSRGRPGTLYSSIFQIFEATDLPGDAPYIENRNYLKLPPTTNIRANIYKVGERYALSPVYGWNEKIYKRFSGD